MMVLDASFLVSFAVENESQHHKALELMNEISEGKFGEVVLFEMVFSEACTVLLRRTKSVETASSFAKLLSSDFGVRTSEPLLKEAVEEFSNQKSGKLSLTDCVLVSAARRYEARIATFDEALKKAL
jgi:predicted nucleic acid-binding protein